MTSALIGLAIVTLYGILVVLFGLKIHRNSRGRGERTGTLISPLLALALLLVLPLFILAGPRWALGFAALVMFLGGMAGLFFTEHIASAARRDNLSKRFWGSSESFNKVMETKELRIKIGSLTLILTSIILFYNLAEYFVINN